MSYKKPGGEFRVILKKGVGQHPQGLEDDPTPIVEFILRHVPAPSGH